MLLFSPRCTALHPFDVYLQGDASRAASCHSPRHAAGNLLGWTRLMRRECEKQCLPNRCMQRDSSRSFSCLQGLPDHAHEPTLRRISKDKLLIASPAGAKVAEGLGFTNVVTLDHGQETMLGNGKLRIKATVGMHSPQSSHIEPYSDVSSLDTTSSELRIPSVPNVTAQYLRKIPTSQKCKADIAFYWVMGFICCVMSAMCLR